jgi:hypothetical protein
VTEHPNSRPILARLEAKTQKSDGCWLWTGAKSSRGYGSIWYQGRTQKAHRVWWEVANGVPFPEGMHGCHHCDNPPCVNPAHIFPGTDLDNVRDAIAKRRPWGQPVGLPRKPTKPVCRNGHPRTPENTITRRDSTVSCRICRRKTDLDCYYRRRAREVSQVA